MLLNRYPSLLNSQTIHNTSFGMMLSFHIVKPACPNHILTVDGCVRNASRYWGLCEARYGINLVVSPSSFSEKGASGGGFTMKEVYRKYYLPQVIAKGKDVKFWKDKWRGAVPFCLT